MNTEIIILKLIL